MAGDPIVVGLDGSPSGRAALRWAAEQARLTDSPVRGVHIVDWPIGIDAEGRPVMKAFPAGTDDARRATYRREIEQIFAEVSPESGWHLQFEIGQAGHVLAREARGARLLVVGTGQHVGLGRVLLGSTSHYCLSHAPCPIVAVPAAYPQS